MHVLPPLLSVATLPGLLSLVRQGSWQVQLQRSLCMLVHDLHNDLNTYRSNRA